MSIHHRPCDACGLLTDLVCSTCGVGYYCSYECKREKHRRHRNIVFSQIIADPPWPTETPLPTIAWSESLMLDARDATIIFDSLHPEMYLRGRDLELIGGKREPSRLETVTLVGRFFGEYEPLPGQDYWTAFREVFLTMEASDLKGQSVARWVEDWTIVDKAIIMGSASAPHIYFANINENAPAGLRELLQSGTGVVVKSISLLDNIGNGNFYTVTSFCVDILFSLRFRDDVVNHLIPFTPHFAIGIDAFADVHREEDPAQVYRHRLYLVSERAHAMIAHAGDVSVSTHLIQTFQTWFSFEGANRIEGFSHNDAHAANRMLRSVEGTPFANRNWLYARPLDTHGQSTRIGIFRILAWAHQNQLVEIIDFGRAMASRPHRQAPIDGPKRDDELLRLRRDMQRSILSCADGTRAALNAALDQDGDLRDLITRMDDKSDKRFLDEWALMNAFRNAGVEFVGLFDEDELGSRLLPDDILVAKQALVTPDSATEAKFMRLVTDGVLTVAHPFMKTIR